MFWTWSALEKLFEFLLVFHRRTIRNESIVNSVCDNDMSFYHYQGHGGLKSEGFFHDCKISTRHKIVSNIMGALEWPRVNCWQIKVNFKSIDLMLTYVCTVDRCRKTVLLLGLFLNFVVYQTCTKYFRSQIGSKVFLLDHPISSFIYFPWNLGSTRLPSPGYKIFPKMTTAYFQIKCKFLKSEISSDIFTRF